MYPILDLVHIAVASTTVTLLLPKPEQLRAVTDETGQLQLLNRKLSNRIENRNWSSGAGEGKLSALTTSVLVIASDRNSWISAA